MIFKKKPQKERRKGERRKPGERRFAGRLVGITANFPRKVDRRKSERRKK